MASRKWTIASSVIAFLPEGQTEQPPSPTEGKKCRDFIPDKVFHQGCIRRQILILLIFPATNALAQRASAG